jgi:hypothetical protein
MTRKLGFVVAIAFFDPRCAPSQERPPGTNRLYLETSPYLQLHARNPVDWYPWGEEAIALSRQLDRPIFLSVGYSTCYWCHRMEEDVFEKPDIAAIMNANFINIKVDREERPDLDEIYMSATQLITRRGGWPNSVFLTPELEPFFAGTYFPPEDHGNTVGFPTVLARINELWTNDRANLEATAGRIRAAMEEMITARADPSIAVPPEDGVDAAVDSLRQSYDAEWGGFGPAPKFPSPANLFLLYSRAAEDDDARRMLVETLNAMCRGALYDHVGGGFHRYATDRQWRVPHFEKMLYDNAFLAEILIDTAKLTGDGELARFARGTLDFVLERMTHDVGGFQSAIDSQTDLQEGAYYVFSREELDAILTDDERDLLGPIFGFDGEPNFEQHLYTVYLTSPLAEHAARLGTTREKLLAELTAPLAKLRKAREKRELPLVDDKVLTDWNGMMITAMAKGGEYFDEPRYRNAAKKAASFILDSLVGNDDTLQHAWRNGEAKVDAFLDDYAFMMRGLLALYAANGEGRWLEAAEKLAAEMENRLRDPGGGYFQAVVDPLNLFQTKAAMDGAIPSGNGVAIDELMNLAQLTGNDTYTERAESALRSFAAEYTQFPSATKTLALSIARYHRERGPTALAESLVETSVRAADGRFEIRMRIRDGWHVNANPASSPYLIPTEVRGDVDDVRYPKGEMMSFSFTDDAISVYGGEVTLEGELSGKTLILVYQACDDSRCLSPVERTLEVEAR